MKSCPQSAITRRKGADMDKEKLKALGLDDSKADEVLKLFGEG